MGNVPEILILTSHFLQRYKERFLKQPEMSANEVAARFLSRNRSLRVMPVDERLNKRIEEYGEFAGEGFLGQDGFCFKLSGEETIGYVRYQSPAIIRQKSAKQLSKYIKKRGNYHQIASPLNLTKCQTPCDSL